jgi:hypothetical protein
MWAGCAASGREERRAQRRGRGACASQSEADGGELRSIRPDIQTLAIPVEVSQTSLNLIEFR